MRQQIEHASNHLAHADNSRVSYTSVLEANEQITGLTTIDEVTRMRIGSTTTNLQGKSADSNINQYQPI